MRVGSLFSGVGGFDLGLERAGHEVVWQVENDAYCQKVLAKHWPDVPCYEDVHDCGAHNLAEVDVICGGFPCQPVSVAGKQRGQDDERWLWPEFARILRELRPKHCLVENVPGLLVRGMGDVLGDLAALGYSAEWGCVSAASVGAPHLRKRIFVIGYTHGHHDDTLTGVSRGTRTDTSGSGDVAHTDSERGWTPEILWPQRGDTSEFGHDGEAGAVAHTASQQSDGGGDNGGGRPRPLPESGNGGEEARSLGSWWSVEPNVGRVADGVPNRVDRLRGLGNAIVPQVAEWIGRRLPSEEG